MRWNLACAGLLLALAASLAPPARAAAAAEAPAASAAAPIDATADATRQRDNGITAFHITPADDAWRAALPRDADAATQAYMARLPADVVARSNAYFEGGYWLILWNFLLGLVIAALLLGRRRSARLRDWAQRIGRRRVLGDAIYGVAYSALSWLLGTPLAVYQGYVREHQYGLATQTFGPWLADDLITLAVSCIAAAIVVPLLYAAIRRSGERWWLTGTAIATGFIVVLMMVEPVWIDPLFNTYRPVQDPAVKAAVLQLARADGVPADNVYQFDASRQTTAVSANVSGLFGSAAVRLNDNMLRRCSLAEIRASLGHELGHYVMNHVYKGLCEFSLLLLAGFLFAQWAMRRALARWGAGWGLQGVGDVASLPLLVAVFSVFMFVATPINNTMIRTQEIEADRFGLNLAREPLGEAELVLKLTEYRKPDPGPIEEFIFFDHPSTRFRVHDAMRWRQAMGTP